MNLFGLPINITNKLGVYSLISLFILFLFYFMKPKPFKKIIPSLIFLESSSKRQNMTSFFKKFVKDWIFLLQFLIVLLLCLSSLGLSTDLYFRKINKNVVLVIDASASSKIPYENKILFDRYKELAKDNLGVSNSIILIKDTPSVIAQNTNPINALRLINSLKPTDSISNIWDSMMLASQISDSEIIVFSDFIDTSNKDPFIAKKIIEAKGIKVSLINPREDESTFFNIGIIKYIISKNKVTLDVKNFNNIKRTVSIGDETLELEANTITQFSTQIESGINKIEMITNDDLKSDDVLYLVIPKDSENRVLYVTNQKKSYLYSAFTSLPLLTVEKNEPPIVQISDEKMIIFDKIDYSTILPGTMDKVRDKVKNGATLIIAAQEKLDTTIFGDLLAIEIINEVNADTIILNNNINKYTDYDFGLSSKYYQTKLVDNNSIIIAQANDKTFSPVIVLSNYGKGKVLYYGIIDDNNAFKLNSQYPLFWINIVNDLISKKDLSEINLKIGSTLYGKDIKDPNGKKFDEYTITDTTGIYIVNDEKIAINLLNSKESDINGKIASDISITNYEKAKIKQEFSLLLPFIILIIILSFFEILILKKRGDI